MTKTTPSFLPPPTSLQFFLYLYSESERFGVQSSLSCSEHCTSRRNLWLLCSSSYT